MGPFTIGEPRGFGAVEIPSFWPIVVYIINWCNMTEHLTEKELLDALNQARTKVEVGAVYSYYRDPSSRYLVTDLAIIVATQEVGVIYRNQTGSKSLQSFAWIRPLSSWLESVSTEKGLISRFCKVHRDKVHMQL